MKPILSGRCICGDVTYQCESEPKFSIVCQCRQCQRITGTGHSPQFVVESGKTTVSGNVQTYAMTSDQGNDVISAFCGKCGNPIYKTTSMMPDVMAFHAATLDDPSLFKPEVLVHSNSAQPWDYIDPELKRAE